METESGSRSWARRHLWSTIRPLALWGNLLYGVGFIAALNVLLGLGGAPGRAYANVLLVVAIAAATPLLNVRAAGPGLGAAASGVAIVLNLACLGYLVLRVEYAVVPLELLAALVPLLNIAVVASAWRRPATPPPAARKSA
ncbi:MAG: hypothetical protein ACE5EO_12960 [Candidatus Krumholzibacteriia bacterium]